MKGLGGMLIRLLLSLVPLFMFTDAGGGAAAEGDQNPDTTGNTKADPEDVTGLKSALEKERTDRKKFEADAKAGRDAQRKLAELEEAQRKHAEKVAKEQGEWEKLATTREAELTTTAQERDAIKAEREVLAEYARADIEAITKTVKAAKDSPAAKALLDFYPGDDADPLQQLAWAQKAKARLPELDAKATTRGNGPNPKPGDPAPINERQEIARIRSRISL